MSSNIKQKSISMRVSAEEYEKISSSAKLANLSMSEYVIQSCLATPPAPKRIEALIAEKLCVHNNIVRQLSSLKANNKQSLYDWEKEMWLLLK